MSRLHSSLGCKGIVSIGMEIYMTYLYNYTSPIFKSKQIAVGPSMTPAPHVPLCPSHPSPLGTIQGYPCEVVLHLSKLVADDISDCV